MLPIVVTIFCIIDRETYIDRYLLEQVSISWRQVSISWRQVSISWRGVYSIQRPAFSQSDQCILTCYGLMLLYFHYLSLYFYQWQVGSEVLHLLLPLFQQRVSFITLQQHYYCNNIIIVSCISLPSMHTVSVAYHHRIWITTQFTEQYQTIVKTIWGEPGRQLYKMLAMLLCLYVGDTQTTRCITYLNYVSSLLGSGYTLLCHQATWIGAKLTDSAINAAQFAIVRDGSHVFYARQRTRDIYRFGDLITSKGIIHIIVLKIILSNKLALELLISEYSPCFLCLSITLLLLSYLPCFVSASHAQICQPSLFPRETHDFRPRLTALRFGIEITRFYSCLIPDPKQVEPALQGSVACLEAMAKLPGCSYRGSCTCCNAKKT